MGEKVLPAVRFGSVSTFNAEGKYEVHKDQPMETAYMQLDWYWTEWDGTENSKIVDIPYKRYPRTFVEPPSCEMSIVEDNDGNKIIASDSIKYTDEYEKKLLHTINLFLEIFGECEILDLEYNNLVYPVKSKRLNWKILPEGKMPWDKLKEELDPIIKQQPLGKQPVITDRFSHIEKHKPDFHAVGTAGFNGYVVFGFPKKDIYILESMFYGNATYVLDRRWDEISQLTKAEILNDDLHLDRIIHREGWANRLNGLMN